MFLQAELVGGPRDGDIITVNSISDAVTVRVAWRAPNPGAPTRSYMYRVATDVVSDVTRTEIRRSMGVVDRVYRFVGHVTETVPQVGDR